MSASHPGRILPQDLSPQDSWDDVATAVPVSQSEIDDLLYGDDRPPADRIARLAEIADRLRDVQAAGTDSNDPAALIAEIEDAIASLRGATERDPDMIFDAPTMDEDPLDHRETLSPDSDELESLEEEDEASLDDAADGEEVLDPGEWDDGDGFDTTRRVH